MYFTVSNINLSDTRSFSCNTSASEDFCTSIFFKKK